MYEQWHIHQNWDDSKINNHTCLYHRGMGKKENHHWVVLFQGNYYKSLLMKSCKTACKQARKKQYEQDISAFILLLDVVSSSV